MFRQGQRIQYTIKGTRAGSPARVTIPGVVVSQPVQGTRPGTNIVQSFVEVVSLREAADGRRYLKKSTEQEAFLATRGAPYVKGLDVDEDGTVLSIAELQMNAYRDLQNYLGGQPASVTPDDIEELSDAPLTPQSGTKDTATAQVSA